MASRSANRDALLAEVGALLASDTTLHWIERLTPLGLVVAPVETLPDALQSEHTQARGMVAEIPTEAGPLRLVANPIKNVGTTEEYGPPPLLGEHNAMLGLPGSR
jgi:crotonobetainyl-CoA:carnitine CoA-transferase CaiB-like acyl-CoA transferase